MNSMFNTDLIDLEVDVQDEQELFDLIGGRVIKKEYATLGYISGLEKRELSYPTGLKFSKISIALPHVDPKYIKKAFIYVVKTRKLLDVKQMGDSSQMSSRYFLFLGLKNGAEQPKLLAKIMAAFQNDTFVNAFQEADKEKMYKLLVHEFEE
ncbi:PTS sugar transporter subunit IIA [Lactobacillus mulieris]|uniref:PTS sugar transporter subunit IIA n=1 Tax=Lactobacillus TaxID=1578 RepID=UPI00117B6A44|nr:MULTISPECIES: PTS sugar transporter subunit IIA [Lactobacillus]KAA9243621.1 PTS sugar transporter subunit IIA [Lactobacillus jensenii]MCW8124291.1 PTS sugar transporter subunit IIA [Lactobacillus mulieris]MCZ9599351.1 PTS sugar transporter subunit IIA [Lactobacillus mulieris]MDK7327506.1 PTS sugar transporter subunit IIA [Lactobacillus mulieris]TRT38355.1 PTS sugar transporter subunit IIA [Lactobacillus sp. c10Ua232AE]